MSPVRQPDSLLLVVGRCGIVACVLTWAVHMFLKGMLRVLSPYNIDGTIVTICGGLFAALFTLYFCRTVSRPTLRTVLCVAVVLASPFVMTAAGLLGMTVADFWASKIDHWYPFRGNQKNRFIPIGYLVMPLVWTLVLGFGLRLFSKVWHRIDLFGSGKRESEHQRAVPSDWEMGLLVGCSSLSCAIALAIHYLLLEDFKARIYELQVEGGLILMSCAITSAVCYLFFSRTLHRKVVPELIFAVTTFVMGIGFGMSGMTGYDFAQILLRLLDRSNAFHEYAIYGYELFPVLWALAMTIGLCWYYRTTHSGLSLFDTTTN